MNKTCYLGMDIHKKFIRCCMMNAKGSIEWEMDVATERETLLAFARTRLGKHVEGAMECTFHSRELAKLLRPFMKSLVISNPQQTQAIACAKVKTDKVDARILAQLLRCEYLPLVWEPDEETSRLRALLNQREGTVQACTMLKHRIISLLDGLLIQPPCDDLFSAVGREFLKVLEPRLPEDACFALQSLLRQLKLIEDEVGLFNQRVAKFAYEDERAKLLMTLPGVDRIVALHLLAAWGRELSRFKSQDHAASYLGLAPKVSQSAARCHYGKISKAGNSSARHNLVQAAQHAGRSMGPLGDFFRRIHKRKNRNIAVVATARKMATIAYQMLTNNEAFRYANPMTIETKLSRLRVEVTGKRLKRGSTKGETRPDHYGEKIGKKRPPLNTILAKEGLPLAKTVDEMPAGEQQHLQRLGLTQKMAELQQVTRRAKAPAKELRAKQ